MLAINAAKIGLLTLFLALVQAVLGMLLYTWNFDAIIAAKQADRSYIDQQFIATKFINVYISIKRLDLNKSQNNFSM